MRWDSTWKKPLYRVRLSNCSIDRPKNLRDGFKGQLKIEVKENGNVDDWNSDKATELLLAKVSTPCLREYIIHRRCWFLSTCALVVQMLLLFPTVVGARQWESKLAGGKTHTHTQTRTHTHTHTHTHTTMPSYLRCLVGLVYLQCLHAFATNTLKQPRLIHRVLRVVGGEHVLSDAAQERQAAVKMQAVFRGRTTRRELAAAKRERPSSDPGSGS